MERFVFNCFYYIGPRRRNIWPVQQWWNATYDYSEWAPAFTIQQLMIAGQWLWHTWLRVRFLGSSLVIDNFFEHLLTVNREEKGPGIVNFYKKKHTSTSKEIFTNVYIVGIGASRLRNYDCKQIKNRDQLHNNSEDLDAP